MRKVAQSIPAIADHRFLDAVDLEMCRAIAKKIRQKPALMRIPQANLRRWQKKWGLSPAQREWKRILDKNPLERILKILTQENDEGQRLRQSDPFVGILTEKERLKFLRLDERITL